MATHKYIVSYSLDYEHRVCVAVQASSNEEARATVEEALDEGTLWDDAPDRKLLVDEFEEMDGNVIELDVRPVKDFPRVETGVICMRQKERAMALSRRLAALRKWGEPDEDEQPFNPSDGLQDSHDCLMGLIDEARAVFEDKS